MDESNNDQPSVPRNDTDENEQNTNTRPLVRGLDYPAFDVSAEAVFGGDNDHSPAPTSNTPDQPMRTAATNFLETLLDSTIRNRSNRTIPPLPPVANPPVESPVDPFGGSMLVTVHFVFNDPDNGNNRAGSIVLSVPNVPPENENSHLQDLIRMATNIAFNAISRTTRRKGTTIEAFNSFPIKPIDSLDDSSNICSICYEDYVPPSLNKESEKRGLDMSEVDESDNGQHPRKKRKLFTGAPNDVPDGAHPHIHRRTHSSSSSSTDTTASSTRTTIPTPAQTMLSQLPGSFKHFPVEMPCGHVFGKSCLFEWLKDSSTCPLCRHSVADIGSSPNETPETESVNGGVSTINFSDFQGFFNNRNQPSGTQFIVLNGRSNDLNGGDTLNTTNDEAGTTDPRRSVFLNDLTSRIMESINRQRPTTAESSQPQQEARPQESGIASDTGRLDGLRESGNNSVNYHSIRPPVAQPASTNLSTSTSARTRSFLNGLFSGVMRSARPDANPFGGSLLPMGVASRRTTEGVTTMNLDNTTRDMDLINDLLFNPAPTLGGGASDEQRTQTTTPSTWDTPGNEGSDDTNDNEHHNNDLDSVD